MKGIVLSSRFGCTCSSISATHSSLPQAECNATMFCVLMLESCADTSWLVSKT